MSMSFKQFKTAVKPLLKKYPFIIIDNDTESLKFAFTNATINKCKNYPLLEVVIKLNDKTFLGWYNEDTIAAYIAHESLFNITSNTKLLKELDEYNHWFNNDYLYPTVFIDVLVQQYDRIIEQIVKKFFTSKTKPVIFNNDKTMPKRGSFIMWKKVYGGPNPNVRMICMLEVPEHARRIQPTGYTKFRVDEAKVLGFYDYYGKKLSYKTGSSLRDVNFIYKVGEIVRPEYKFETDKKIDCASGIYGYMDFFDAVDY